MTYAARELGDPDKSEWTVVKVDAYNGLNRYFNTLEDTRVKTIEDVVLYNEQNRGTEGAEAGDHAAFPSGQASNVHYTISYFADPVKDNLKEIIETQGRKDETYKSALQHMHTACRRDGIDAALKHTLESGEQVELDGLLMCDRKGVGQQLAAQAGYPIISIPLGLDDKGLPVQLSVHHKAWQEGLLVKWASAIEDMMNELLGRRPCPTYRNYWSKNIPVK